ncbi:hypothetical protein G6F22_017086 [Rhizopus arrhizus]|nr:hypothetical protein G6F22_017086 [Rhizopus arrhizus]
MEGNRQGNNQHGETDHAHRRNVETSTNARPDLAANRRHVCGQEKLRDCHQPEYQLQGNDGNAHDQYNEPQPNEWIEW